MAEELWVVRLFDGFDNEWMDITEPVSKTEADRVWNERTKNGTEKVDFNDIDYYKKFLVTEPPVPAQTNGHLLGHGLVVRRDLREVVAVKPEPVPGPPVLTMSFGAQFDANGNVVRKFSDPSIDLTKEQIASIWADTEAASGRPWAEVRVIPSRLLALIRMLREAQAQLEKDEPIITKLAAIPDGWTFTNIKEAMAHTQFVIAEDAWKLAAEAKALLKPEVTS